MLRLAYLVVLYQRYGGNVWALLKGEEEKPHAPGASTVSGHGVEGGSGGMAPASQVPPVGSPSGSTGDEGDVSKDPALVLRLKRRKIREKITPLMMLTSIVADLDLFADCFFVIEGLEGQSQLLSDFALTFTIIGTCMYVLVTLEFHPVSKAWTCFRTEPLRPGQHLSLGRQLLLNVVVEDIPQLVITVIADPTSAAGVLNISTAGFSLLAKAAEAVTTLHDPPMSAQSRNIEEDPEFVQYLHDQQVSAQRLVATTSVLVDKYREEVLRGGDPKRSAAVVFEIMQADGGFMGGALGYVRKKLDVPNLDISSSGLKGAIPSEAGGLSRLMELDLSRNRLEGPIPTELGNLSALTRLELCYNKLSGGIPRQLGVLRELRVLILGSNSVSSRKTGIGFNNGNLLTGAIPMELGNLSKLEVLVLSGNRLSGSIPSELVGLSRLTDLDFSYNHLNGPIPTDFGNFTALTKLVLCHNKLDAFKAMGEHEFHPRIGLTSGSD